MQAYKRYRYRGKEVCVFPIDVMKCTQIAGLDKNGNFVDTTSHDGTYAYDFAGYEIGEKRTIYAPVTVTCTQIEITPAERGNRAWFVSNEPVKTPSGDKYVYFYLIHDNDVSDLVINQVYKQGTPIYTMGTAGDVTGVHVHIEAKTGSNYPGVDINEYETWHMIGNEQIQTLFYSNDTDIVNGDIGTGEFKEFVFGDFVPYENGWNYHKSETYYVENMQKVTGWKKVDNCWYFFNPASGENHKDGHDAGEMLTGWQWLDDHWYFFGEGGIMQTGWVWSTAYQAWYYFYTSGSEAGQMAKSAWIENIYYVLSDGKMAKNCQILYNGKYYAFNNSGECLNTSGQTSPYNTTTYPIKS